MRRLLVVLLAIGTAHADPLPDDAPPPDSHPVAASLYLGGAYAAFGSWMYVAWYYQHKPLGYFRWGGDGLFGDRTYAGGADKLGHAWATMSLARGGTELLSRYGGYDHLTSSLVSAALAETLFFFVEVKDGFYYEFSYGDFAFDTIGALAAIALDNFPRLDEMFDYRVQWWPSTEDLNAVNGGSGATRLNIAEDYSGETYLLPSPPMGYPAYEHHLFDWLLADRCSCAARRALYKSWPVRGHQPAVLVDVPPRSQERSERPGDERWCMTPFIHSSSRSRIANA